MAEAKNYVGSGKEFVFQDGGSVINISLKKEDIDKLPVNDKGYIYISVSAKKTPDDKSTHSVYENTFKPKPKENDF